MDETGETTTTIEQIAEQCVAVRLRLLTRAVTGIYNRALRPHGLTVSQMNILVAVSCMREAKPREVCRALHLEKSTLSRDAGRMHRQGWIDRLPGENGRTSLLRPTAAGRKLLQRVIPAWEQAQHEAIELLGKERVATLRRAATSVRSAKTAV